MSDKCKGLFFRGYRSMFMSGGGMVSHSEKIELKQGIRFLKGKSCAGCPQCGWWWDSLAEDISDENIIFPEIKHGAIYSIRVINESTDYETGYIDDYDTEIFKVENTTKKANPKAGP
jgi:hypothetical protein